MMQCQLLTIQIKSSRSNPIPCYIKQFGVYKKIGFHIFEILLINTFYLHLLPNVQKTKYLLRIFITQFQLPLFMNEGEKIIIVPKPTFTTSQVFHQLGRNASNRTLLCMQKELARLEEKHITMTRIASNMCWPLF